MASQQGSRPDALDEWVAEVGTDHVVGLVDQTRRDVAAGTVPAFDDKEAFVRYLARRPVDKPA